MRKKRKAPRGRVARLGSPGSGALGSSKPGTEPAASGSTPSAGARRDEEARQVREALARISDPAEKEVVRLRFFEGLSFRKISERLGLSYDQVRDRFHRGMGSFEAGLRRRQ